LQFSKNAPISQYQQKWIFLIGLGLIVPKFPSISGELTDKSKQGNPFLHVSRNRSIFLGKFQNLIKPFSHYCIFTVFDVKKSNFP
jgi:hypothetical protein